jgi:competence protein ComEC
MRPTPVLVGLVVIVAALGVAVRWRLAAPIVLLIGVGVVSGLLASGRNLATLAASVPSGPGRIAAVAVTDSLPYGERHRIVAEPVEWQPEHGSAVSWSGPPLELIAQVAEVVVGDRLEATGVLRPNGGFVRGDPVAGRLTASNLEVVGSAESPLLMTGNLIRRRVQARLGDTPEAALLAGFLIGDTAALPPDDVLALRRSGLTHYVAVSGSNVALVLGAWWIAMAPFELGARWRAITGMIVLCVFVVATRWESSVIRAATMAALVLGGRAMGAPIDAWTALGGAVTLLVVVSGDLAYDVGFQLSVAATAGVLAGLGLWQNRSPRLFWGALAATVSAQAAVVPLLLLHFGTVPLLSPLANLIAAPLVTTATALAGLGVVVGWSPAVDLAEGVAGAVLAVARLASDWPQLDAVAVALSASIVAIVPFSRWRTVVVAGVVVANVVVALPPGPPGVPTVVFLDVGQGDAVLLLDPSGAVALVDGGRDPTVLAEGLRRHGIDGVDLVVTSHGDADHVGGLDGVFDRYEIGRLWVPAHQPSSELLHDVVASAGRHAVAVDEVAAGLHAQLGEFELEVFGPQRRYAEANDGSIVLLVQARGVAVLLPGDIGRVAQAEMPSLRPDVLLVPHHGADTTDLEWLRRTAGDLAVISVGLNSYGHPDPDVVDTLRAVPAVVRMTRREGDIVVPLR